MTEATLKHQSIREIAEMIATFRTQPGVSWGPLANDIETALKAEREDCAKIANEVGYGNGTNAEAYLAGRRIAAAIMTRNP